MGEQAEGRQVHGQAGQAGVAAGGEEVLQVVLVAQRQGAVSGVAEVGFDSVQDAAGDALAAMVGVDGDGVDVADSLDEGAPDAGGDLPVEHPRPGPTRAVATGVPSVVSASRKWFRAWENGPLLSCRATAVVFFRSGRRWAGT